MSRTTSFLLLLILWFAVCSSHSRPIGVINNQNEASKSFDFSSKNEEKSSLGRASVSSNAKPSNHNESERAKEDGSFIKNKANKQATFAQKVEHHDEPIKDNDQRHKVGADDDVQRESLKSVSWKLPHPKRGEAQPGFNLDYEPPKMHPPVHN